MYYPTHYPELTRPLKKGEILQKGDLMWFACSINTTEWEELARYSWGVAYIPGYHVLIRRPITQSMEFICSNKYQPKT